MKITSTDYDDSVEIEKMVCTDVIEGYLLDNYPHLYNTTTRREIRLWVEKYLESKK